MVIVHCAATKSELVAQLLFFSLYRLASPDLLGHLVCIAVYVYKFCGSV